MIRRTVAAHALRRVASRGRRVVGSLCLLGCCAAAAVSPTDAAPLTIEEVAPGVLVHRGAVADWGNGNDGDVANLAFVVGSRCIAVIDTGGTPAVGRRWLAALRARTDLPVCYVINTHAHPDHLLGNVAFRSGLDPMPQFVGHQRLPAALAARARYYLNALQRDFAIEASTAELVLPGTLVEADRPLELDLGGRTLVVTAWPTAHTDHDLTVFDRQTRTLFLGDLLFREHLPVIDGSLRGWLKVLDTLGTQSVALAVPGHGATDARAWPEPLAAQSQYLRALLTETRAALKAGVTLQQAVRTVGLKATDGWALVDRFHERNVTTAFAELEWED